jgi:hypothetical protein
MAETDLRDGINTFTFIAAFVLLSASLVRISERVARHRALGGGAPLLLYRDMMLIGALTLLVVVPAAYYVLVGEPLTTVWWVILRSVVVIGALAWFTQIEWFVIGRDDEARRR